MSVQLAEVGQKSTVYFDEYDMDNLVDQVDLGQSYNADEHGAIGRARIRRTNVTEDGSFSYRGTFIRGSGELRDTIRAIRQARNQHVVTVYEGVTDDTIGQSGHSAEVGQFSDPSQVQWDQIITIQGEANVSGGRIPIISLAPKTQRAGASGDNTLSSVDNGSSSDNGAYAALHIFSTDAELTVKIEDSSDDSTFADLITFDAASAAGVQAKRVTGTVDQYARVSFTLASGNNATFAVAFGRLPKV